MTVYMVLLGQPTWLMGLHTYTLLALADGLLGCVGSMPMYIDGVGRPEDISQISHAMYMITSVLSLNAQGMYMGA